MSSTRLATIPPAFGVRTLPAQATEYTFAYIQVPEDVSGASSRPPALGSSVAATVTPPLIHRGCGEGGAPPSGCCSRPLARPPGPLLFTSGSVSGGGQLAGLLLIRQICLSAVALLKAGWVALATGEQEVKGARVVRAHGSRKWSSGLPERRPSV